VKFDLESGFVILDILWFEERWVWTMGDIFRVEEGMI